jgi:hypothetical protein
MSYVTSRKKNPKKLTFPVHGGIAMTKIQLEGYEYTKPKVNWIHIGSNPHQSTNWMHQEDSTASSWSPSTFYDVEPTSAILASGRGACGSRSARPRESQRRRERVPAVAEHAARSACRWERTVGSTRRMLAERRVPVRRKKSTVAVATSG